MMSVTETAAALVAACRTAGVDPTLIFEHYNAADIAAYAEALRDGSVKAADLHLWMASTARTIAEGRCLCRACSADTGKAMA